MTIAGSLKVATKSTSAGLTPLPTGSACELVWSMVTVGATVSYVTVLPVLVEAGLFSPVGS